MPETYRHHLRVIYAHCTLGNHVYHSRYLDLMEAARGEFMRSIGYPVLRLQDDDYIFPVIAVRMKFLAPARYDDQLTIEITLKQLTRLRLTIHHRILRDDKLLVEAETDHVCTSIHEKPKRLPQQFVDTCAQFLVPSGDAGK
jgi:acyl-CoA thioester hydrolase